jgi:hypothetical protein
LVGVVTDISTICEKAQKALPVLKYAAKVIPLLGSGSGHAVIPESIDVEVLSSGPK